MVFYLSRREGIVKCGVCSKMTPAAFSDRHHITPQSVGMFPDNSGDNLIWLCSGCHQNLHTLSHYVVRGASVEAEDLAKSYYDNSKVVKRILNLTNHVAKEVIAMREGERKLPEKVVVSVELPRQYFTILKLMSLERRGHRQFAPFIREHLITIASKYQGITEENNIPVVDHIDFT